MSNPELLRRDSAQGTEGDLLALPLRIILALCAIFASLALAIYWPSLNGAFISDDLVYIMINPWVEEISGKNVLGIFDPFGEARAQGSNYAPLTLLSIAFERAIFFDDPFGYHVVNVLLHSLNATLLVALLFMTGLPLPVAVVGGLFFLVHPGNVEAVAWPSQIKTNGSLVFSLGALLAIRRHPGWATLLFVAGLLTKASAAAALPMAAALLWCRDEKTEHARSSWIWLALWLFLFLLYSVPQFDAIHPRGTTVVPAYEDVGVHLRTIASIGVHYLVMAYTTLGIAHAQEHPPVFSWLDLWWLAAIPLTTFFIWRIVVGLRDRKIESIYWIGAAAAFVPVSQLMPFLHPIANRYLYFVLPGLIGGTLFLLRDVTDWLSRRRADSSSTWPPALRLVTTFVVLAGILAMSAISTQRAHLWTDQTLLSVDSAQHFPEGRSALILRAKQKAQIGDAAGAVELLRRAADLGRDLIQPLVLDEGLAPIADDPLFRALIFDLAGRYLERVSTYDRPTQSELGAIAMAHFERGEVNEAVDALERAVAHSGPYSEAFASELEALKGLRQQMQVPQPIPWRPNRVPSASD
jgi:hypothetical protein